MPDLPSQRKTKTHPRLSSAKILSPSRSQRVVKRMVSSLIFSACVVIMSFTTYIWQTLPTEVELRQGLSNNQAPISFYDRQGRLIYQWEGERRQVRPLHHFPDMLIKALLASEDQHFFEHMGLHFQGIVRVIVSKIWRGGRLHGGSTITQQLAKSWVGRERTFWRKFKEAILALKLEYFFTKGELLERYLNLIYLGEGAYGFEEASWTYFNHSASTLTLDEAALLAALPPRPSRLNPIRTPYQARLRRDAVLNQLLRLKWIDREQGQKAMQRSLHLSSGRQRLVDWAPSYLREVKRQLTEKKLWETLKGHRVVLTLDLALQQAAEKAMREGLHQVDRRHRKEEQKSHHRKHRRTLSSLNDGSLQGALIALDLQRPTRRSMTQRGQDPLTIYSLPVLAALGGSDEHQVHYHRATRPCLSIASTVKPFIYGLALHSGKRWGDLLSDAPISIFDDRNQLIWRPREHHKTRGRGVTMLNALSQSLNSPVIHLTRELGIDHVRDWLKQFGLHSPQDLTLALGSGCASPQQLTLAYTQIALGTMLPVKATWFRLPTYSEAHQPGSLHPLDPWLTSSELDQSMIQSLSWPSDQTSAHHRYVLDELGQGLSAVTHHGTARSARHLSVSSRGKTGTHEQQNTWFVGYTPSMIATVWVGTEQQNTQLGRQENAARSALPIWLDFMKRTNQGLLSHFPKRITHDRSVPPRSPTTTHSLPEVEVPF